MDGPGDHLIYELTGPDPLSPPGQVTVLGGVLGISLGCREADPTDVTSQLVSYGMPTELAHAVVEVSCSGQEPFNSQPTGGIAAATGKPARSKRTGLARTETPSRTHRPVGEGTIMTAAITAKPLTFADERCRPLHPERARPRLQPHG